MSTDNNRFDYFHEASAPEGADGWESMYPYYLVPSEETREHDDSKFWFADTMHWSRGVHPFDSIGAEAVYYGAGVFSTRIFSLPVSLGLDVRVFNGYVYISPTGVTDPAMIQERAQYFQKRAGYYYENWPSLYEAWKTKMEGVIADMREITFPPLPDYDPDEVVFNATGRSVSMDILENYHKLIDQFLNAWQYHFEFLNLGYGGYITFFQFCKNAFPLIDDQTVSRMVAGVDVLAFRPDGELRKLGQLAAELGIVDKFPEDNDPEKLQSALSGSAEGDQWLAEFEKSRNPWFNYFTEYGFTHDQDTWNDDLSVPLKAIADYARAIADGQDISRPVERLQAERDEIVSEYRKYLNESEAVQFDELLKLARTVFPYIEEHNIYVEHWTHDVFWKKAHELAEFFVSAGFFENPEDMFYLNRFEVDTALADLVQAWAIGVSARGKKRWQAEVERRKPIVAAMQSVTAPPAYSAPPAEITDPFAVMNYGVTTERVNDWLSSSKGAPDTLNGIPASPGQIEGVVRVLRSEKDLPSLQPDEILVAPITAPSWASAFAVASAVITDIGGMMSHAAIVCREYGIPAVVGTGFATARLKTGQRVRLDGKKGTVEILET
ncbi:pyruvate, water dikinase [Corynebacterium pollutisoli]|uniref:Pyruvate, water dikinase n=1 Tax=Corynebacterium pollutisoli TaxID=1610489 RepID=A0A1X7K0L4_9CORY|nr:PEP-utilizing enzyme [Corynebacterium pollutisoli]SMG34412.1 pyruvate, water dikinase [Corynebacterium pollutisoli]